MNFVKRLAQSIFRIAGYDVRRIRPPQHPVNKLIHQIARRGIDVVFDVGANTGQFARELRSVGYAGRIVSFEPVRATFAQLASNAGLDPQWDAINCALGATEGTATINVSRNTWSSSIRPLAKGIVQIEPAVEYVSQELVPMRTLDGLFANYVRDGDRVFLKLDVQGFENEVLKGASQCLRKCEGALAEASLTPVYQGEWLLDTMLHHLRTNGFTLFDVVEAFRDPNSGQLLQVDVLFWRGANEHHALEEPHATSIA